MFLGMATCCSRKLWSVALSDGDTVTHSTSQVPSPFGMQCACWPFSHVTAAFGMLHLESCANVITQSPSRTRSEVLRRIRSVAHDLIASAFLLNRIVRQTTLSLLYSKSKFL